LSAGLYVFAASALFEIVSVTAEVWLISTSTEVLFAALLGVNLALAYALYRFFLARSSEALFRPVNRREFLKRCSETAVLLSLALLGTSLLQIAMTSEWRTIPEFRGRSPGDMSWLSDLVLAPLAEEISFRWILYRSIRVRLSVTPSVLITATAFSLAHLGDIDSSASFLWLGIVLSLGAERFRNIESLVATHALYNLIALYVETA
jgi:membrane protease YdiL (CAAX protease family)